MISFETSAEIPWLSKDLRTSGTSTVPVWDIGGECLLGCQGESAVFSVWEEDWDGGKYKEHILSMTNEMHLLQQPLGQGARIHNLEFDDLSYWMQIDQ